MMLTVTRPIEQALMEVPGIRRVRSTTFRGATEISGAVRFERRHDRRAATSAGPCGRHSRHAAGRPRPDDRSPDARGLPLHQRQSHREPVVGRSLRLWLLRDAAGVVARSRRRQRRGAVERQARDRGDCRPDQAGRGQPHHRRRFGRAGRREPSGTGRQVSRRRAAAPVACLGHVEARSTTSVPRRLSSATARRFASPTSRRFRLDRPIGRCSSAATAMSRPISASRNRSAPTSWPCERAWNRRSRISPAPCRPASRISKTYDLAEFVATAIANVRDAILVGALLAVCRAAGVSARLAPDAGRIRDAAAHGDDDVPGHAMAGRNHQRHVDGRPGGCDRPGHRRCRGGRGEHSSAPPGRPDGRPVRSIRAGGAGQPGRRLHVDDRGRVSAARHALGCRRTVLSRVVDHARGGGSHFSGSGLDADSAAGWGRGKTARAARVRQRRGRPSVGRSVCITSR